MKPGPIADVAIRKMAAVNEARRDLMASSAAAGRPGISATALLREIEFCSTSHPPLTMNGTQSDGLASPSLCFTILSRLFNDLFLSFHVVFSCVEPHAAPLTTNGSEFLQIGQ
jgi:hypothetical protein